METEFYLSSLVNSFEMTVETSVKKEGLSFFYNYQPPSVQTKFTVKDPLFFINEKITNGVMKMEHKGRFWFDKRFMMDVYMQEFKVNEDGSISATYTGMNILDITDNGWLPRFFRWILRRQ